jgi:signal transduction histidine kinase
VPLRLALDQSEGVVRDWLMDRGRTIVQRRNKPEQTMEMPTIMHRSYLLDTSSFVNLASQVLQQLCVHGHSLYASPYVFWERLCHLEGDDFHRSKGQLLSKFQFVKLLDDPHAHIERSLLPSGSALHDRSEDADLIYAALAALKASESLVAFYSSQLQDPKNGVGTVMDVTERRRAEEERQALAHANRIMTMGQLTASIAHEVNQPIAAVVTNADRHRATGNPGAAQRYRSRFTTKFWY